MHPQIVRQQVSSTRFSLLTFSLGDKSGDGGKNRQESEQQENSLCDILSMLILHLECHNEKEEKKLEERKLLCMKFNGI